MSDTINITIVEDVAVVSVTTAAVVIDASSLGAKGDPGPTGPQGPAGASGNSNLYIQQANPAAAGTYLWYELNPDNTLKTIWVKT
jgi:hypothetical protein